MLSIQQGFAVPVNLLRVGHIWWMSGFSWSKIKSRAHRQSKDKKTSTP